MKLFIACRQTASFKFEFPKVSAFTCGLYSSINFTKLSDLSVWFKLCHLSLVFVNIAHLEIVMIFFLMTFVVYASMIKSSLKCTWIYATEIKSKQHIQNKKNIGGTKVNPFVFGKPLKQVLLQTVKTQMKCSIMLHFIRVYTVCKGKKDLQTKNVVFFENYNMTPLDMYNGLPKFNVSTQKEESISIQRVMEQF